LSGCASARAREVEVQLLTLREAAERTSRSVTTLRRYIRSGRLRAEKRAGRYGQEYFVSEADLAEAGLDDGPETSRWPARELDATEPGTLARLLGETVPAPLFRELQMKHEQLLVQYGMVRMAGLRARELEEDLASAHRAAEARLQESEARSASLVEEIRSLGRRLREAELELAGRGMEVAALEEKVRALELLTRNAVTNETIERQFSEVMEQIRRVDELASGPEDRPSADAPWTPAAPRPVEPEH
jgi:hypothetical protein